MKKLFLVAWLCSLTILPTFAAEASAPETVNLLIAPLNLAAPVWKGFSRSAVLSAGATAPDNASSAFRLTIEKGGFFGQVVKGAQAGHTYVFSLWVKSATGAAQNISLAGEVNVAGVPPVFQSYPVTGEWARIHLAFACPQEGNKNYRFSIRGGDLLIWHPQVEDVTGKAPEPSEFRAPPSAASLKPLEKKNPPAAGTVQNIACWGDSLTQGAGGTPYPAVLQKAVQAAGLKVYNGGIGGQTSVQIRERFLAAPDKFNDIVVIWAGRNNYSDPDRVLHDVAQMVDAVKTDRFLVLSVLNMNTEVKGSGAHAVILEINKALAQRYQEHFYDIRAELVGMYRQGDAADVKDHDNDVPPSSLRSDGIHLNAAGYQFVAQKIHDLLLARQWVAAK